MEEIPLKKRNVFLHTNKKKYIFFLHANRHMTIVQIGLEKIPST
jgi:hypothetical protein